MALARHIFRPSVILVAQVSLAAIFPGVTGWVNDEAILMEMAFRYNRTASDIYGFPLPFTPSPFGLLGTRGARYGPLPVWVDQILLAFTHNLIAMTAIRAIVVSALIAIALYQLSRALRLSPWFVVFTMLSPWLWFFSRSLWDSTWCIPISAGLFAGYAVFLSRPSGTALRVTLICDILLPMVHLVGVVMSLPVAIHLLVFHRRSLWKWKWSVAFIAAACLYLLRPYLTFFFTQTRIIGMENHSALLGLLFPLLGGHYLTLGVAGTTPADGWQEYAPQVLKAIVRSARCISWLALLAVWLGMILAASRAWRALRIPTASVMDHLCLIGLSVWLCQTILDGFERLYSSPHYYVATWIVYAFFAWIAVDWLLNRSTTTRAAVPCLAGAWAVSVVLGLVIIFSTVIRNAGTYGLLFGTSVGNQIDAVKKIQQFSGQSNVEMEFPNWQKYPLAMKVLMELNPPPPGPKPVANLVVKYRNAYPGDARLEVQEQPLLNVR